MPVAIMTMVRKVDVKILGEKKVNWQSLPGCVLCLLLP
jgi:hypothetical protein